MSFNYLSRLVAKLELQGAQYHAELEKANRKLDKFAKDSKKSFTSIDKAAKDLTKGLAGLGKLFGVGGAVALGMRTFGNLAREADQAIKNLASSNANFAKMLEETSKNFERWNRAGQETIKVQEAINKASRDPAMAAAMRNGADLTARLKSEVDLLGKSWAMVLARVAQYAGFMKGGTTAADITAETAYEESQARFMAADPRGVGTKRGTRDAKGGASGELTPWEKIEAEQQKQAAEAASALEAANEARLQAWEASNASYFDAVRNSMEFEKEFQESLGTEFTDSLEDLTSSIENATDAALNGFEQMSVYADQAARNMQDAFADFLFDPFSEGLDGMLKGFIDVIRRMIAESAAASIFKSLGLSGSNGILGAIGGLFGGARAMGGPVSAGKSYLVGEQGPELFTPRNSGHITPNGSMGGATVNISVDARGATQDAIALLPAVIRQASDDAVARINRQNKNGRL